MTARGERGLRVLAGATVLVAVVVDVVLVVL
jgi:hypothetical protein